MDIDPHRDLEHKYSENRLAQCQDQPARRGHGCRPGLQPEQRSVDQDQGDNEGLNTRVLNERVQASTRVRSLGG
jgi:hypothetical protein